MYKHTTKSYKSVVSDVQVYADHIFFKAMGQLGTQQTKGIGIAEKSIALCL